MSDKGYIGGSSLKQFLSHTETKLNLIIYLTDYSQQILCSNRITYATTYEVITINNKIKDLNLELENHDHEEAGMLGVFHAIDAAKRDLFTESCIFIVRTMKKK